MSDSLPSDIKKNQASSHLPADMLKRLPVAIYTCDADGYITWYNEAAVKLWGRQPVIGEDMWCGSWKIIDQDGLYTSLDTCPMARVLKERIFIDAEEIIVERPDGIRRHVLAHPQPTFSSSGVFSGAINTLVDITDQKGSEENQARLAAIVESSDDAIISKRLDGHITSWNSAAERMFGYTQAEAIGKHITMLIPPSRMQEENTIIQNIIRGNKVDHFETIRITKYGKEIPISLTVSPIKDNRGVIIGASKIARDITVQMEAKRKLQLYNNQLQKINSYKDEFIGMASHELKTPLTSVNLYLQMLERSIADEKNKKFVSQSVNQINKLNTLISDLLDVAKIQSGKLMLRPSDFDLPDLIGEVAQIIQDTTDSHRLIIESEDLEKRIISADRHRIEQVLINLLTNAVKYSPKSRKVILKVSVKNERFRVAVTDFGIGVPEEQQERIFSRFYRIEESGPSFSGLGIGLYISSEIINRHGGEIWVESQPGVGSTFIFELPAVPIQHLN